MIFSFKINFYTFLNTDKMAVNNISQLLKQFIGFHSPISDF